MDGDKGTPSIKKTAFCCPFCEAYTTHFWHSVYVRKMKTENPTPFRPTQEMLDKFKNDAEELGKKPDEKLVAWIERMLSCEVFVEEEWSNDAVKEVGNLSVSICYNCRKVSVWVGDSLIFPAAMKGSLPNEDLPDEVKKDYLEARSVLDASPRSAAAMLRLGIQKLCKHLGGEGKNIDKDISFLVSQGLSPLVQKSLDVVRVSGNESVHPGELNLNDNREMAERLFDLVNIIAEQMITNQRHVKEMYEKLPESKRAYIEERNAKASEAES